ncbi:MAG TPA: hypothetical protein VFT15_14450 [Chitinophagaceae bacterium]|nr:hypothetical protein [Chitinophagaceae bacterium]
MVRADELRNISTAESPDRCTPFVFNRAQEAVFMEDKSNDEIERKVDVFQYRVEYPAPPGPRVVTPFNSILEWLNFICEHEQCSEPVSEYMIAFSEPPRSLANLVGYNHEVEEGVPISRIVFQPRQYMWFELPEKEYGGLTRDQLINKVHSELKQFFTTQQFKRSFLARGYNISTNFQEDVWSL